MCLKDHIKYSSIPSLALLPFIGLEALYFFLGSILIDVDHYITYVTKFKSFSINGMFEFYDEIFSVRESRDYLGLTIFHTVEFLAFVCLLSFFFPWLWFVWLGMVFHWTLDLIYLYEPNIRSIRALSIIEYLVKIRRYRDANQELEASWLRRYLARKGGPT